MSLVQVGRHDRVAVVTLNDPERRNALNADMVGEIVSVLDTLETDDDVGALVITGAPPAFCAGANLGNLAEATRGSLNAIYEGFLRVARSALPTIAAVNGAAVGAGMNLALVCDVRLAARRARFDTRFLDLGLHPGGGHTWMLRNAIGGQGAAAMVLFGQVLDGEAAERAGLVWRTVADEDLLGEAVTMAARAASGPKPLTAEIKASLREMTRVMDHGTAIETELARQVWSTQQGWFAERLASARSRISSR